MRAALTSRGVDENDKSLTDRPMRFVGGCSGITLGVGLTVVYVDTKTTVAGDKTGRDFFCDFEKEKCTVFTIFMIP
jgi:hypothetical protein